MSRDKATNQLEEYKKSQLGKHEVLTNSAGNPIGDKLNIKTVGPRGPMVLEDVQFLDEMGHFTRERIPERVVHAKGAGAFGYFEVTHDITKYSKAGLFSQIGKKTPLMVRFSTVAGESGTADTVRDIRGFAVKFYTEEGNWDLVGNNTPTFFIRDPIQFPSLIHTLRNPVTHLRDPNAFWDFAILRPETAHQLMFHFNERSIPDGYRHMHGYGSNTFKLLNAQGVPVYCKFQYKTNQGIKNLEPARARKLAATDPDYAIRDLYNAIADGNYPSYTFYVQVMTFAQAEKFKFNPFDVTKVWPQADYPLIPVGTIVLDRNPKNYFTDVEQSAFSPANMPPGIEPSPDKMLQGRLFAYDDTLRHRLGANFIQLPPNYPYKARVGNYQRDGPQTVVEQTGAPNYYPNSFSGPVGDPKADSSRWSATGDVARYNSSDNDNFSQPTNFYVKVLKPDQRKRMAENIAAHIGKTLESIQERGVKMFSQVHPDLGRDIQDNLNRLKKENKPFMPATLSRL